MDEDLEAHDPGKSACLVHKRNANTCALTENDAWPSTLDGQYSPSAAHLLLTFLTAFAESVAANNPKPNGAMEE